MPPKTEDYESLLDLPNVIGVDVSDDGTVTALVSQKVHTSQLADDDHIAANVQGVATDVEDMGFNMQLDGFIPELLRPEESGVRAENLPDRQQRQRPIPMGVSEMHHSGGAATGGYFPCRVTDTDATTPANWAAQVQPGDYVKLANNHSYAVENGAAYQSDITQPSPLDATGSTHDSVAGHMVGYVMLADGVTVDVAARSADITGHDVCRVHDLSEAAIPQSIYRDDYAALDGVEVVKSGRTTGVTRSQVRHTSATIRVGYGGHLGALTLRDQIVTGDLSNAGDSGSPVFVPSTADVPRDMAGACIGQLFAGGPNATIVNKAANIESEFGVEFLDWSETEAARARAASDD